MSSFDINSYKKISVYYKNLGEKKLLKKSLNSINIDKKVFMIYFKYKAVPICVLPKLKLVLTSKRGFLSFCYNFFNFANAYEICVPITAESIELISKFVISHEIGHILDNEISKSKEQYSLIICSIVEKIIKYNIDLNDENFYKCNIPEELENNIIDLKKNLIDRESKAWNIAKSFVSFKTKNEEFIFNKVREYALATYNFGNLKNVVEEHNIETMLKYSRFLA